MNTPMTELPLAAVPHLLRDEDATAAARLEDLLELRDRARVRGYRALAQEYTDRIVAEVLSCPDGLNGPGGHAA